MRQQPHNVRSFLVEMAKFNSMENITTTNTSKCFRNKNDTVIIFYQ